MSINQSYTLCSEEELYQIIISCRRNERLAQERMYKMYYSKMMNTAMRYCVDSHQAEDIVNMGFLKCFKKIETFTFQGSFEGWLRKIIVRTALDNLRLNEKHNENVIYIEKDEVLDVKFTDRILYDKLLNIINELPKTTKIVFINYYKFILIIFSFNIFLPSHRCHFDVPSVIPNILAISL